MNSPRKVSSTHLRQMSVGSSVGSNDAPDGSMNDSYVAYMILSIKKF